MEINDLTYAVRGCLFRVHTQLGPGLLESIYEEALTCELELAKIPLKIGLLVNFNVDNMQQGIQRIVNKL